MSGVIRPKHIQPEDELDRIFKAWLADDIDQLELRDRWLLERMEYADALLREGGNRSKSKNIIKAILANFPHHQISSRTAENDIARAKRFFLSVRPRDEKDYALGMHIEWGKKLMWEARKNGDLKAAGTFYKELSAIQRFKYEDIERPDYTAIQPPPVIIVTDPAMIGIRAIDNLEEELIKLMTPKGAKPRNTENIDEAELEDDGSIEE